MENKKPCDISNLMSPPEPTPYDSFNSAAVSTAKQSTMVMTRPGPNPPLSPPTSPARTAPLCPSPSTEATNLLDPALSQPIPIKDPILFPIVDKSMSPPAGPLFTSTAESLETIANTDRLVDEHIASRPASLFREVQPPRREEYKLALYFKTDVLSKFSQNPRGWLSQEKELLRADRKNTVIRPVHKLHTILPASTPTMPRLHMAKPSVNLNRVQKIKSPKLKTQNPRPIRATPTPCRQTIPVSATPEPRTRTVAPNREDKDFESLPDYCPPLSSLPNKSNSLKVDWKGNALDLSKDPHRHLLHDDEIHLAAGLRLDCATYLTSKRRIFMRRLDCAKIPKEFRKTDAQQACKIDVNKASKLWTAYDKVGWLDRKWVERFL
ncbi:hypothetical protein B0H66DRAFT_469239 [Apodospora peruviana]|uniref:SWIRM domain-containing protein n=1 Tax=Apodospora peruviana TaxID=516989 RepID=A0AAE0IUN3_9PEZI|nr:hypothetical protein B0H66DRAFT_469239 [Apodospora peruviana]